MGSKSGAFGRVFFAFLFRENLISTGKGNCRSTMPGNIIIGCRVSANVGEFLDDPVRAEQFRLQGKRFRRHRERLYGIVLQSKPSNLWCVRLERDQRVVDLPQNILKFEGEGPFLDSATAQRAVNSSVAASSGPAVAITVGEQMTEEETVMEVAADVLPPAPAPDPQAVPATVPAAPVLAPPIPLTLQAPGGEAEEKEEEKEDGVQEDPDAPPEDPDFAECEDWLADESELLHEEDIADAEQSRVHMERVLASEAEKTALMGTVVEVGKGLKKIQWIVRADVTPEECTELSDKNDFKELGIRGFNFTDSSSPRRSPRKNKRAGERTHRVSHLLLFQHLWPGDWKVHLRALNSAIRDHNEDCSTVDQRIYTCRKKRAVTKECSQREFWVFFGILFSAAAFGKGGDRLFDTSSEGIVPAPNLGRYMSDWRFKELRALWPLMFQCPAKEDSGDPWWKISSLIDEFNEKRRLVVAASRFKTLDESMSAFAPQTSKTGNLPHLSWIARKPEPLGTEFKNVACTASGLMIELELQEGKMPMREKEYSQLHGVTAATSLRLLQGTKRCGQVPIGGEDEDEPEEDTFDVGLGDSWFCSVELVTQSWLRHRIAFAGIVKTSHSRCPKEWLEKTMVDWPSGSHLVMEGIGEEGVPMIIIGYKYNSRKVIVFLSTKNIAVTTCGKPYRARWRDTNHHGRHRDVKRPSIVSFFFLHSNSIDRHNHARQFELRLEKFWVTANGYFRIFTTIAGINATDAWKAYRYQLPVNHADKTMTILKFCDIMTKEMLENKLPANVESDMAQNLPLVGQLLTFGEHGTLVTDVSSLTTPGKSKGSMSVDMCYTIASTHKAVLRSLTLHDSGKHKRARRTKCTICSSNNRKNIQTSYECVICNVGLCRDGSGKSPNEARNCETEHQNEVRKRTAQF
jgi:Transposase IS4